MYSSYLSSSNSYNNIDIPSINYSEDPVNPNYKDFDSLVRSSHNITLGMDWSPGSMTICPLCALSADGKIIVIDEWFYDTNKIKSGDSEITVDMVLNGCIGLIDKHYPNHSNIVNLKSPHDAAIIRSTVKAMPNYNARLLPIMFKPACWIILAYYRNFFIIIKY
jgi:hypothetical protein